MDNVKESITNLSKMDNSQYKSIWNKKPEENLMALSFFCNGNNDRIYKILDRYKRNQTLHFFNDIVREDNFDKTQNHDVKTVESKTLEKKDDENDDKLNMCLYLLLHLFVNIISQLNKMRSICGLEQQLNPNFENDIIDLRIVEYGFNYFSVISTIKVWK